ncbi:putative serine esterase (DUF676) domain containing protein [Naviculisporaceae sp. PSN 640]
MDTSKLTLEECSGGSLEADHLCVLVHGLWGNPNHMLSVAQSLRAQHPRDKLWILVAKRNSGSFTYDGIETGGERVCHEIEEELEIVRSKGGKITKISVVGYSLGGLVARYAIGLLFARGVLDKLECMNFTAFASPFLGVRSPHGRTFSRIFNALGARTLSLSGQQLFGVDKFRDTGKPLVAVLADPKSIFMSGLSRFKRRTLYANVVNDRTAVYYTTSFSKTDPFTDLEGIRVNYVKGYEDVVLDPVDPVTYLDHEEKTRAKSAKLRLSIAAKVKKQAKKLGLVLVLSVMIPIGVVAYFINSAVQTVRSSRRVKLHEQGLAGINVEGFRKISLWKMKEIRDAVEDAYEELSNDQPNGNGNGNSASSSDLEGYKDQPKGEAPSENEGVVEDDEDDDLAVATRRRRGSMFNLQRKKSRTAEGEPVLALAPYQFEAIKALDSLGWNKYGVYIHNVRHSHAAIIERMKKPDFAEGLMRSSRAVKETTSRFFDNAGTSAGSLTPRRSTRSSTRLARNAHEHAALASTAAVAASSPVKEDEEDDKKEEILGFGSDIEDAVITRSSLSPRPNGGTVTRKRKRTATTTAAIRIKAEPTGESSTSGSTSRRTRTAAAVVKSETSTKMESDSDLDEDIKPEPNTTRRTHWEEIYALVKEMRISGPAANAAVDTMGCERLASPEASARDRRFHTLVALMLSSQTKDTVNAEAMIRLKNELPPYEEGKPAGLNLENMLAVEPAVLNELIGKVGFHNNKTKYLKQAAIIMRDQHNSDIPTTLEGLMSLPGVGPKMAHLCMGAEHGWNQVTGIGVDVHVHRITNLWGWQAPPTKTPEETRLALESWLPKDKWKEINWLLVGFGQKVCLPVGRKCGECQLGLRGLCKSAERKKVIEGRRRVKVEVVEEKVEKKEDVVKMEGEENGGVERVKKEEVDVEERKVVVKKEEEDIKGVVERVVNEEVPPGVKKSDEEDGDDLSFVKTQVKDEGDDVKKSEDSSFVNIKKEEEDGDVKMGM